VLNSIQDMPSKMRLRASVEEMETVHMTRRERGVGGVLLITSPALSLSLAIVTLPSLPSLHASIYDHSHGFALNHNHIYSLFHM
jgi:hypothetical protein